MTELNLIGTTLDHFEILSELGRGGMAVVYKARQINLDRIVALKVLPPALTHDASYVTRFRQEAKSAARLDHPHIMPIYEVGEANGLHYIAMKYIQGRTVKELLHAEGRLSVPSAAQILAQVGDALDYAHRQGFIHRDIKPSNMMITAEGWVYLTDFGLARATANEQSAGLTMTGTVMGTPEYMSPEQAQGLANLGPPTDIYAFGIVLYELLTGSFPFDGDTPLAILAARLMYAPRPPRDLRSDLPTAVEDVVMRALARKPEARFPTAAAMVSALRSAAGIGTSEPQRPTTPQSGLPAFGATVRLPAAPAQPDAAFNPTQPVAVSPPTPPRIDGAQQGWLPPASSPPTPATAPRSRSRLVPIILGLIGFGLLGMITLGLIGLFVDRRPPVAPPTTSVASSDLEAILAAADTALAGPHGLEIASGAYQIAVSDFPNQPTLLERLSLAATARGDTRTAELYANPLIDAQASTSPQIALGYALLSRSLAEQGDLTGALVEIERAIAEDPDLALGYAVWGNLLARRALAAGSPTEMDAALQRLDQAVDRMGSTSPLLQAVTYGILAEIYAYEYQLSRNEEYFNQSADLFGTAIDQLPSAARFRADLANLYIYANDVETARALYNEALQIDSGFALAQAGLGWIAYNAGDTAVAEEAFARAIAIDASWYGSYYGQARLRFDSADYDAALSLLEQARELNPRSGAVLGWIGETYFWKGFYAADTTAATDFFERSAEAFTAAQQLDERDRFAISGMGWTLQYLGRFSESVETFNQVLLLDPNSAGDHNGRGWSLFNLERYSEAEADFREAIRLNDRYVRAYVYLGRTLEQQGRLDEARAAYEQALTIDPNSADAQRYLQELGP